MHVWRCPIPLEWDTAGTGRKMAFGGWECGFWPGKGQIDAGTPHPGDGTLWDMQGAMDNGQLTMDNAKRAADCRSTVYFPLSTLSAAGRPPPPPLLHSVSFCCGRSCEEGEPGSSGDGHTGTFGIGIIAFLALLAPRRFNFPRAQTVRNAPWARQVQTFTGEVRTFWPLFERFFDAVGGRNRDIRLETGVRRSVIGCRF